jgi:hypothetical protein
VPETTMPRKTGGSARDSCLAPLRHLWAFLLAACGGGSSPASPAPAPPPPPPHVAQTVLVDEAHNNSHTLGTTLAPLGSALRADGYSTSRSTGVFQRSTLELGRVLLISNALHERNAGGDWSLPTPSAFTSSEIATVRDWVNDGGSLLLIADHMPFPGGAADMAAAFGITFSNGFAFDSTQISEPQACLQPEEIQIFRRSDGSLRDHPITNGRNAGERVDSVATFTGQAFETGSNAESLMVFGPDAVNLLPDVAWVFTGATPRMGVEGWSQGAMVEFGAGRVAFFGEAAMFTEQACGGGLPMGMNAPAAAQNRRLMLNVFRWLFGEL